MTDFLLQDHIQIQAPVELRDRELSTEDKQVLVDSFFSNEDADQRGLFITFDLSHSGKVINNRIYQPWAQDSGVPSWLSPAPKPIIKNHDRNSEPLGRIVDMKWESLQDEAVAMVGAGVYNEVAEAYNSRDAKEIGRVMNKHGLVDNADWPGLGKLVATARITDKDAIDKFLDGRYLQFSAGARTNRVQCSECAHNLRMHDMCDHTPGVRLEDGSVPFMVTNTYNGREASVVNFPADTTAMVTHMTFDPQALGDKDLSDFITPDFSDTTFESGLVLCDSVIQDLDLSVLPDKTDEPKLQSIDIADQDPRDIARTLFGDSSDEFVKALEDKLGDTTIERGFLIRMHDALHREYDWQLKYQGTDAAKGAPLNVFKFHGKLHELAVADGYRDDFINGPLDTFDSKGGESTEYVSNHSKDEDEAGGAVDDNAPAATNDSAGGEDVWIADEAEYRIAVKALRGLSDGHVQVRKVHARGVELGIADAQLAVNGLKLIDLETKAEDAQRLADAATAENETLKGSLAEALKDRTETAETLQKVLDFLATEKEFEVSEDDSANRLDVLTGWFATLTQNDEDNAPEITPINLVPDASTIDQVDDPTHSEDNSDQKLPVDDLSSLQKRVVRNYHNRVNDYDEANAKQWLAGLVSQDYVSADFDPSKYTLTEE